MLQRKNPDAPITLSYLIRLKRGISQAELAAELECDEKTVDRWESGGRRPMRPYQKRLESMAMAFEVDLSPLDDDGCS